MGTTSVGGSMPLGTPHGTSFVLQAWLSVVWPPNHCVGSNGLKLVVP
jgi:hypothetical protein